MKKERGVIVAVYGMNNIGKSSVLAGVKEEFSKSGLSVACIKYPIYDSPTGKEINAYLREGNPKGLSALDAQKKFAENRFVNEPKLVETSRRCDLTILEDYFGTGIAWGELAGIKRRILMNINRGLLIPDVSILLDGERFKKAAEKNHMHEGLPDETWNKGREIHKQLANKYGWRVVSVVNGELDREIRDVYEIINSEIATRQYV